MNCNTTHYRANSSSVPGDPTRIADGAKLAAQLGLEVHAGHGLDYRTAEAIAALPQVVELNIGHYMMGDALFVGLSDVVKKMRAAMDRGRIKAR